MVANKLWQRFRGVSLEEVMGLPEGKTNSPRKGYVTSVAKNATIDAMFLGIPYQELASKYQVTDERIRQWCSLVLQLIERRHS